VTQELTPMEAVMVDAFNIHGPVLHAVDDEVTA